MKQIIKRWPDNDVFPEWGDAETVPTESEGEERKPIKL